MRIKIRMRMLGKAEIVGDEKIEMKIRMLCDAVR